MRLPAPARHVAPIPLRPVLAGVAASLVGIGLARFAYTPLIPVLIERGWFAAEDAFYLGAANLAGYLAGALLAPRGVRTIGARAMLRGMMALAALSFFACAAPLSFAWYFLWRFAAGLSGGALMAIAAPSILPGVPAESRGRASGIIFTGVGLGAALSGTLIPWLLGAGLATTWIALGAAATLLALVTWRSWPANAPPAPADARAPQDQGRALRLLYAQYGLNAAGLVPHMVFLVDFVARGSAGGFAAGAMAWIAFGLGAVAGPFTLGAVADRIGFSATLRASLAVQLLAIGALAVTEIYAVVIVSATLAGAFTPGIVPLVLGRVREILAAAPDRQQAAWSRATASFALMQAAGAYGFSFLFAATGDYALLFLVAAGCLALALALEGVRGGAQRPASRETRR
ncbi:YbfB/YjiJ family MFS transporter [Salinarimonas sp.]|uniref:YbfB/YjiJ family MFS transporter n=1 Tax=Salinarimonas sp. TaxID=2766526 RepID=UPI0032D9000E